MESTDNIQMPIVKQILWKRQPKAKNRDEPWVRQHGLQAQSLHGAITQLWACTPACVLYSSDTHSGCNNSLINQPLIFHLTCSRQHYANSISRCYLCALRSAPLHKTLAEVSGVPAQKWNGIYRIPPAFFELVEVQGPAETNHNHNLCGSCASTNYTNPCSGMRKYPKTIAQLQVERAVWIPEAFCFAYPNHDGTKLTIFCKPG